MECCCFWRWRWWWWWWWRWIIPEGDISRQAVGACQQSMVISVFFCTFSPFPPPPPPQWGCQTSEKNEKWKWEIWKKKKKERKKAHTVSDEIAVQLISIVVVRAALSFFSPRFSPFVSRRDTACLGATSYTPIHSLSFFLRLPKTVATSVFDKCICLPSTWTLTLPTASSEQQY